MAEARDCIFPCSFSLHGPLSLRMVQTALALVFTNRRSEPWGFSSDHRNIKIKHPSGCLIFMADGEGFEPPVELPPQRFSRPPHSTALPTIRNYLPPVFQPTVLFSTAHILHYFFLIANIKIDNPAKNIIADNNWPIVRPHDVRNPIWTSGARNNSQNIRNTAYPIPIIPPNAPG